MTVIMTVENVKSQERGTANTSVRMNVINLESKYTEQNKISVKINRDMKGRTGTPKNEEKSCKNLH